MNPLNLCTENLLTWVLQLLTGLGFQHFVQQDMIYHKSQDCPQIIAVIER
jgi:hypothetical protein